MTPLTLNIIQHSLGHTMSGKLIHSYNGVPRQFHAAHIKWTSKEHFEAAAIILKRMEKKVEGEDPTTLLFFQVHTAFGNIKKEQEDEKGN